MYTGKLAPQLIDPARLEQGVKFLHAYPLIQEASLNSQSAFSHAEPSIRLNTSLYGIQISGQQAAQSGRLSSRRQSSPVDSDGAGALDGKGSGANVPSSSGSRLQADVEMEAMALSSSQVGREGSEADLSSAEAVSALTSGNPNTILHVKPSIMKRNSSFRKHYTCHICGSRFNQRAALREHLLWHAQAMAPLMLESGGATSPILPGGAATPEVEEVLTGVGASAATPIMVDVDVEQTLSGSKVSPPGETAISVPSAAAAMLCTAQLQADTPPPSDIADIDNLEGAADIEREVKRRKYECPTCGRKFIQKSHWREHMYIHTGKPYRCSACGKSFCRANQAARHVCMSQGAESAYTMVDRQSMELCAADDSSQMEALFLGSSGRPYKCNVCEMTFTNPNEVIKHMCFTQGAASGTAGSGANTDQTAKDEGSDVSSGGSLVMAIKTEEVLVD